MRRWASTIEFIFCKLYYTREGMLCITIRVAVYSSLGIYYYLHNAKVCFIYLMWANKSYARIKSIIINKLFTTHNIWLTTCWFVAPSYCVLKKYRKLFNKTLNIDTRANWVKTGADHKFEDKMAKKKFISITFSIFNCAICSPTLWVHSLLDKLLLVNLEETFR